MKPIKIKYALQGKDSNGCGSRLGVETSENHENAAFVEVSRSRFEHFIVPKDDAPAVALAILEASGWDGEVPFEKDSVEDATYILRKAIKEAAKAKAKAEDEAKLDAEALTLHNLHWGVSGAAFRDDNMRLHWRKIALKARELHAPKETAA